MSEDVTILFNDGTLVFATAPSKEDSTVTHNIFYNIEENVGSCNCKGWFNGGKCWHVTRLLEKLALPSQPQ
jgi:hypothetical protein